MSIPIVETAVTGGNLKHDDLVIGDRYLVAFRPIGGLVQWLPARLNGYRPAAAPEQAAYTFQGSSWTADVLASDLATRVRRNLLNSYVIHAPSEASDEADNNAGFWSNDCGWTTLSDATRFSPTEIAIVQLPRSAAGDARWLTEPEAKALVLYEELVIDGMVALRSNGSAGAVFNTLIGANAVGDYDAYLAEMVSTLGVGPLRGRRIEYRCRGVTTSATVIPSTRPSDHRVPE